eukprot:3097745-Karenia_brevis.AAC.1
MLSDEIDCDATRVNFDDPETVKIIRRRNLRNHKGTHPATMNGVAHNMSMEELGRCCATFRGNLAEESCPDIL